MKAEWSLQLKRMSLVVLDKEDYIQKAEELLQQPNYKILTSDPTTKHKNKLIALLKSIKADGGMNDNLYKKVYPTEPAHPNFVVCQRCTKKASH